MASKTTKEEANACSGSLSLKDRKADVKGPTLTKETKTLSHCAQDAASRKENIEQRSHIGALSGAAAGAAAGAAVGSMVPAVGTVFGAATGALLGAGAGCIGGAQLAASESLPATRRKICRCCCCCAYSSEE